MDGPQRRRGREVLSRVRAVKRLIGLELEKADPDLVARDDKGRIYTVRYEAVNAMPLNEFLRSANPNTLVPLLNGQFLFDLEFLHAFAQSGPSDAKQLGRPHLVPLGIQQRLDDQLTLDGGEDFELRILARPLE